MYRGTTPTFTLTFPEEINFTGVNVWVTFSKPNRTAIFTKTNEALDIAENVINVFLTQEETLSLTENTLLQVNWTYDDSGTVKRACSNVVILPTKENLINEVI